MLTTYGHLTYCTNIHSGENWDDHFRQLQLHLPAIKAAVSPDKPMGIGLRVANKASLELSKEDQLLDFKHWLKQQDCYVFTMNGFPYGSFHDTVVKDQVHTPDWTQADRVAYTIRLFRLLAALLPEGIEGGISTSPLTYKPWFSRCEEERNSATETATLNILSVVEQLVRIQRAGGPVMHLDIEPEPDGLLENTQEYIDWYTGALLPAGIPFLQDKFEVDAATAATLIRTHVQLCYDVCHFALEYETPQHVLDQLVQYDLKVGKLQISAALRAEIPGDTTARQQVLDAFALFNEPVYLHQVIARQPEGQTHYPDLPQALEAAAPATEWRSHFHVPVFLDQYGLLGSTRQDIETVLTLQRQQPFTAHLEVETYTWDVLPADLKLPIGESIARELNWVKQQLEL
ncbi:metabolite traffic protein EboE [Chitinophaga pendula]|uniref:metabolite traffic protein EboE n=1 Tax=Chitinophaga TaxID=79328 RepID=UPI000BAEBF31|nr:MULTISPECIES: metabolite traffic protein EboE [Chitinophaga]ASZ09771.1 xylose isomerase [Chitinophaga sp. MD30]UCJ07289.1 metabolite traffic protein EboE [Chitinophaga pendula]